MQDYQKIKGEQKMTDKEKLFQILTAEERDNVEEMIHCSNSTDEWWVVYFKKDSTIYKKIGRRYSVRSFSEAKRVIYNLIKY